MNHRNNRTQDFRVNAVEADNENEEKNKSVAESENFLVSVKRRHGNLNMAPIQ